MSDQTQETPQIGRGIMPAGTVEGASIESPEPEPPDLTCADKNCTNDQEYAIHLELRATEEGHRTRTNAIVNLCGPCSLKIQPGALLTDGMWRHIEHGFKEARRTIPLRRLTTIHRERLT